MIKRAQLPIIAFAIASIGCGASAKKSATPDQHRPAATACATARAPGTPVTPQAEGCRSDADCTTGHNGRCVTTGSRMRINQCSYDECFADKDCPSKGLCICGHDATNAGENHYCETGNCRVDSDCGAAGFCSPSYPLCSLNGPYHPSGWYCHTAKDECTTDSDCPRPTKQGYGPTATRCSYSAAAGHWACTSQECPVG